MPGRQPFTVHRGLVAPLRRSHVDTDQIIPKQFLKRIEKSGFGPFLFHDWKRDPSFVLNQKPYAGASILVAGVNFGCGSSREHAAWALRDLGLAAVLSTQIGDIFRTNALENGLLALELPACAHRWLLEHEGAQIEIDVAACLLRVPGETPVALGIEPFARYRLLRGLTSLEFLRSHEDDIARYERGRTA